MLSISILRAEVEFIPAKLKVKHIVQQVAKCTECEVLHMDETRIQCNKEEGKKASSDSFMWVIRSAAYEDVKAAFFYYSRTRSGDVAKQLLSGFHGYLNTDAYIGYEKVENIKRNLCWAHCRRYFIESIPLDNKGKGLA